MQFGGMLQLSLDAALGAVRGLKGGASRSAKGSALLAGSHVVYPTEVRQADGREYLDAGPIHRSFWRTIEWRLLRPICAELPRPLADVGCGDGEFGKTLFKAVDLGVDGESGTIGHCDPKVYLKTALADLRREMPGLSDRAAAGEFASVFSNSTLEHIEGVDDVLENLAAALRPGGRLVFTVPSAGLVRAFSSGFGHSYSGRLNAILGHHNLWTAAEWNRRLKAAGFSSASSRGYMTDAAAQWFASQHLPPWPQLARRAKGWIWSSQLSRILDLVDESLSESDEARTACLLIDAQR